MTESLTIPTIETARTDVALRKMGQFFAAHIHDVSAKVMGTAELREQIDAVALHIRGPHARRRRDQLPPPAQLRLRCGDLAR
ncbi:MULTISPECIES: hypothetical protein [Rhodococcus erythropolis group]|uniref:hypothetical protein n=1 Tax=Rhodococcus erythropolis group TaxID=2840174 RepID=UPI0005AB253D|nr:MULTISPECIES: hypothetical protein [Rhodococcus erythropolis group]MCW0191162.1 hypothetical protein [Rhodococcus sp. (in: high G+C Gram-positive bacteria)]QXC46717.1 hypothetical protein KSE96_32055 [Rhodococcus qingshengii]